MALTNCTSPLDLHLFRSDDDDEDITYKTKLQNLLIGATSPSEAATNFSEWVLDRANTRLHSLLARPNPRNLTPVEEAAGIVSMRALAPNPTGDIEMMFTSIAKVCTAFAPYSEEQERLVSFMLELSALEEKEVPSYLPDEYGDELYHMIKLWPFGGGNWMAIAELFRREAGEISYPYSDIETPGSETRLRWINFQSFIVRITTLSLIDCSFLCSLASILPSHQWYPDLHTRKVGGPNRISGDLIAGAQWLVWPQQCRYVYQRCKEIGEELNEEEDGPRAMWSMKRWREWKQQLQWIQHDGRFSEDTKSVAEEARKQMDVVEDQK